MATGPGGRGRGEEEEEEEDEEEEEEEEGAPATVPRTVGRCLIPRGSHADQPRKCSI